MKNTSIIRNLSPPCSIENSAFSVSSAFRNTLGFSPLDLANLSLWLDASDSSTITESGGLVSEWRDKSGLDNHAIQSVANDQFEYDSINKTLIGDLSYFAMPDIETKEVFVVVSDVESSENPFGAPLLGQKPDLDSNFIMIMITGGTILVSGAGVNSGTASINGYERYSGTDIRCLTPSGFSDGFPNQEEKTIVNFSLDTKAVFSTIGYYNTGARRSLKGKISQVLVFSEPLTDGERLQLLDWIATKEDIQNLLP